MFTREQLLCKALLALEDVCVTCARDPAPKSLMLRFILAWLYQESGAHPSNRWIFDSFWQAVTRPRATADHDRFVDDYCRTTSARSALSGICREVGYVADVDFTQMMADARRAAIPGVGVDLK